MASSGKPKTTYAKLQREAKIRERRFEKAARKQARKEAQLNPAPPDEFDPATLDDTADPAAPERTAEPAASEAISAP
jgi:hypothetical protein